MWNALTWLAVGWWIGSQKAIGAPIVPANVTGAPSATAAMQAAAEDVTEAVRQQASGDSGAGGSFLVASGQDPSTTPPPRVSNTGLTVNGTPVCVDSFMNLVDCTTGQPLDDSSAEIIINSLQQVGRQGKSAPMGRYR